MNVNPTVEKLQHLAKLARQAGQNETAEALNVAAQLVTRRLAQCTAEKTLRDEMAMAALPLAASRFTQDYTSQNGNVTEYLPFENYRDAAAGAYLLADAMLEAREV